MKCETPGCVRMAVPLVTPFLCPAHHRRKARERRITEIQYHCGCGNPVARPEIERCPSCQRAHEREALSKERALIQISELNAVKSLDEMKVFIAKHILSVQR